ncbi:mini-ribonuclease 3 [Collibacillus ludicampi]|jgi:ribonuclease-3 family protein|uniref:Mini-ribonuclease 3 n=1 Tax=Collibacillus ludicampi TaxID=2771369 RepID=A0AAV4LEJ9_9BACL|nr:Mini-ribonuclease 3 [Collibacillus ludicampi]GIM46099.1 mini-ribonuclease 3 [Collibacillus ludicampi]
MTHYGEIFSLPGEEIKKPEEIPGLALAYIGDTVWDLIIRRHLLAQNEMKPDRLHKRATAYVRAKAQADVAHHLLPELTEEERSVMRRGRNAKSGSVPKNADISEYRMATGFESLLGYLYLKNRHERILELAERSIAWLDERLSKERNGPA